MYRTFIPVFPIICFLLFFAESSLAQHFRLILKDGESKEPTPYATIVGDNGDFSYSDVDGSFVISSSDSITVSHVNYGSHTVCIRDYILDHTIYLTQKTTALEAVVVTPANRKDKPYRVGNLVRKSNYTINIAEQMQIVLYMPEDKYTVGSTILSIEIPAFSRKKETYNRLIIRPKLYSVNSETKLPMSELLHQEEVVEIRDSNSKYYSIDLEKHNISLPNGGVFVGFELIGALDERGQLVRDNTFASKVDLQGVIEKRDNGFKTFVRTKNGHWINIT